MLVIVACRKLVISALGRYRLAVKEIFLGKEGWMRCTVPNEKTSPLRRKMFTARPLDRAAPAAEIHYIQFPEVKDNGPATQGPNVPI